MQASQLTDLVHGAIDDLKGRDITTLDVTNFTDITDTMVIATGTSNRHVNAIVNEVVVQAKQAGLKPLGVEGADEGDWVLIDLGDVVVHVMREEARGYYELERLWSAPAEESAQQDH